VGAGHAKADQRAPVGGAIARGGEMGPLLAFENVSKRYPDGWREVVVLDGVSFSVQAGVFVGVIGARRSGKSTLLRLAAGIEVPTAGRVLFQGRDVGEMSAADREQLLRGSIALVSTQDWSPKSSERVIDYVTLPLGSRGLAVRDARYLGRRILERVGVSGCADEFASSLSLVERARVVLAQAVIREPAVLLVDEPAVIPSLRERDKFCRLLRDITDEKKMTLVVASEEPSPLHGAATLLSIGDGELCSTEELGAVVRLPRRSAGGAERSGR
jgi:ABC-type lipoprotein export system ATPase subunit